MRAKYSTRWAYKAYAGSDGLTASGDAFLAEIGDFTPKQIVAAANFARSAGYDEYPPTISQIGELVSKLPKDTAERLGIDRSESGAPRICTWAGPTGETCDYPGGVLMGFSSHLENDREREEWRCAYHALECSGPMPEQSKFANWSEQLIAEDCAAHPERNRQRGEKKADYVLRIQALRNTLLAEAKTIPLPYDKSERLR